MVALGSDFRALRRNRPFKSMPLPSLLKLSSSVNTCFHSTKKGNVPRISWDKGANKGYTLELSLPKVSFPDLWRGPGNVLVMVLYFHAIYKRKIL